MKNLKWLWLLNFVLSIVHAVLGFMMGNIHSGLGWTVASIAWLILLIRDLKV